MIPAIMDSHGKPGIAGSTIGVETEIVVELLVVVGVLTSVIVDTDILTTVVVIGVVVTSDVVDALDDVLLDSSDDVVVTEELEVALDVVPEEPEVAVELELELELELVLVACWPTTGGFCGSR
jgi:hypothetical protein